MIAGRTAAWPEAQKLQATPTGRAAPDECFVAAVGVIRLWFKGDRLSALRIDEAPTPGEAGAFPRLEDTAFAAWLRGFSRRDEAGRWACLDPGGSDFQRAVWRALMAWPIGATGTYGALAAELGRPAASRAVGAAVGRNPIAILIPCHRVLPKAGGLGGFRWGPARKAALLRAEQWEGSALQDLFR
jgi:methylated-DNA-[protein]-cysteine S-methyltransferase